MATRPHGSEFPGGFSPAPGSRPLRTDIGRHERRPVEQLTIDFQRPKPRGRAFWRMLRDHPLFCFGLLWLVIIAFMVVAAVHQSGLDRAILGGTRWRW